MKPFAGFGREKHSQWHYRGSPMFDDFSELEKELIGESPAMVRLFRRIKKFGPIDLTVLIEGESGTGKELVANALHRLSRRSRRLFVPVNCAELTETLAQSERKAASVKTCTTASTCSRSPRLRCATAGTMFRCSPSISCGFSM